MYTISLSFSDKDVKNMLEGIGLEVRLQKMEFEFPAYHNTSKKELLTVWVVINPYTGQPELLRTFFEKYMEAKKKDLFLTVENKLDVYNLFVKKNR